jgi:hypothetical protein
MTTYQGIAAVTQTLSYLIGNAVRSVLPEATVTLSPPEVQPAASRDVPRLNIYLVQVMPEPTMRSAALPIRAANGQLITPPQVALRLRYLFSFFGPMTGAQIMLGATEIALREHGVLDAALIVQALTDHPELAGSGLENQSPPVTVQPSTISLEELSRFWSGFFQASYTLSTVYEAAVVLLTSAQPGTGPGLPVLTVDLDVGFGLPAPELGEFAPVTFADGASVPVAGAGVQAGQFLQIGDAWVPIEETGPGALSARLPANVRAGVTLVRLGRVPGTATESVATGIAGRPGRQPVSPGTEPTAVPITGSAPRVLVVQPVLSGMQLIGASGASETPGTSETPGEIAVTVDPSPAAGQRVALTLVSLNAAGDSLRRIRIGPIVAGSDQSGSLPFTLPAGAPPPAGPYLGLVEVDGVSSVPTLADGRLALPQVTL